MSSGDASTTYQSLRASSSVELPRPPSRVAREHAQRLEHEWDVARRPPEVDGADRADEWLPAVAVLRDRHAGQADHRLLRLHRPAEEGNTRIGRDRAPLRQRVLERYVGRAVEDHAERAVGVVLDDEHDRAREVRVGERRGRHQQPACGRFHRRIIARFTSVSPHEPAPTVVSVTARGRRSRPGQRSRCRQSRWKQKRWRQERRGRQQWRRQGPRGCPADRAGRAAAAGRAEPPAVSPLIRIGITVAPIDVPTFAGQFRVLEADAGQSSRSPIASSGPGSTARPTASSSTCAPIACSPTMRRQRVDLARGARRASPSVRAQRPACTATTSRPRRSTTRSIASSRRSRRRTSSASSARSCLPFPSYFRPSAASFDYLAWLRERSGDLPLAVELRHKEWVDSKHRAETMAFLEEHRSRTSCVDVPPGFDELAPAVGGRDHRHRGRALPRSQRRRVGARRRHR